MSKPVEVEFLMKDKLTPGMNKAEREALELVIHAWRLTLESFRLAGETAAPNLNQCQYRADPCMEKQLEDPAAN